MGNFVKSDKNPWGILSDYIFKAVPGILSQL